MKTNDKQHLDEETDLGDFGDDAIQKLTRRPTRNRVKKSNSTLFHGSLIEAYHLPGYGVKIVNRLQRRKITALSVF